MNEVDVTRDAGVAIVTLMAVERRNALTPAMANELIEVCDELDRDTGVGAVVVQGGGGAFCAGAHRQVLSDAGRNPADKSSYDDNGIVYESFARVGELRAPTIAAVRGAAVGAGVNLLLATDLRIVAEDARIIAGFLRIGIHPGGGHFVLVGRAAGREAAAAMAIFGEEISGRRAVEIGMAWEARPDGEVESRALELARYAAADSELAREAVSSLRLELGPPQVPWPVALQAERARQMRSLRRRAERDENGSEPGDHRQREDGVTA